MKKCERCQVNKPETEFHKNRAKSDGMCGSCKECKKEQMNSRYANHRETVKSCKKQTARTRVASNRAFILEYLQAHACTDCGESDPVVLEFDHVRGVKAQTVNLMAARGFAKEAIAKEITRCVVRCANCHRRKTANARGYFKVMSGGDRSTDDLPRIG